ncbi:MAG TPA: DNRLRE domain-containing protein [Myxococcota bacterium]|jgi:hypothetical protein|nr:DNRLRE domain-containing protein [Myxococcota bacterium]
MGSWPLLVTLASAVPAAAATFSLTPTDDAFVWSRTAGGEADLNFGSDPQLLAWANFSVSDPYAARSYLRFDLSGLPAGEVVTGATLTLFQFNGGGFNAGIDVHRVADDTWHEGTITWNNRPLPFPDASNRIAQNASLDGFARGAVSFDLLADGVWDPSLDVADGALSLLVKVIGNDVGTQRVHNFCSKDAGSSDCLLAGEAGPVTGRGPVLTITTAVPEPSSALLIATGAALIAAARRRPRPAPRLR